MSEIKVVSLVKYDTPVLVTTKKKDQEKDEVTYKDTEIRNIKSSCVTMYNFSIGKF